MGFKWNDRLNGPPWIRPCFDSPCDRPWFWRTTSSKLFAWVQCKSTPIAIIDILFAFTCLAAVLNLKLITEIIENHSEFRCGWKSATNLFKNDNDKSWNYLSYWHVMAPAPPLPPPFKGKGGSAPVMHLRSGVPDIKLLHSKQAQTTFARCSTTDKILRLSSLLTMRGN